MKNYGLRKKPTYDSLIDYIQNKQPTLKYPDRLATQIMNSRELDNLDKIGMIGMEEQQQNIMKEQQRQVIITQQANRDGSTAKNLRSMKTQTPITKISVGETQTKNPKFTSQGTQDWISKASIGTQAWRNNNIASFGTQTEGPPIFDLTMDDKVDEFMQEVQDVEDEQDITQQQKVSNVVRQLQFNLGEITPSQQDFAHRIASKSSSSHQPINVDRSDPVKRGPEDDHEPKGPAGRPRTTQQSDAPVESMVVGREGESIKRNKTPENSPTIRKKTKKEKAEEQYMFAGDYYTKS